MVDRLDIENRICYYCKLLALYVQSHYTKYLNFGGILNVVIHVLIGDYWIIHEVYAGEVKVVSCPRPPFHINEFLSL